MTVVPFSSPVATAQRDEMVLKDLNVLAGAVLAVCRDGDVDALAQRDAHARALTAVRPTIALSPLPSLARSILVRDLDRAIHALRSDRGHEALSLLRDLAERLQAMREPLLDRAFDHATETLLGDA